MNCPNCRSSELQVFHRHVCFGDSPPYNQWCAECGTLSHMGGHLFVVPRRSRPAVPVELPDSDGWWWIREPGSDWYLDRFIIRDDIVLWEATRGIALRCEYVRAEPPIVASPPEPSAKEDAEKLRRLAKQWEAYWEPEGSGTRFPSVADLRRIADRLERLKEGE